MTNKQLQILKGWFTHPKTFIIFLFMRYITHLIKNDKSYLRVLYRLTMGENLNLDNPYTFQEKLQWLKLNNRKLGYTTMVDKYEVKKYVASIIGEEYIIPTLGVYRSFDEINFSKLPNKFVLKCTHDSGRVVICKNKTEFNILQARKKINDALRTDYYLRGREWPYKNVKPRIIAEQYMEENNAPHHPLADYKFYCFDGEPKYCQVIQNRDTNETIDFFDMNWQHQKFVGLNIASGPASVCPVQPHNFHTMKLIASKLSKGEPFMRIDLYTINDKIYFGEITLFPAGGFGNFIPKEWYYKMGKLINININKNENKK